MFTRYALHMFQLMKPLIFCNQSNNSTNNQILNITCQMYMGSVIFWFLDMAQYYRNFLSQLLDYDLKKFNFLSEITMFTKHRIEQGFSNPDSGPDPDREGIQSGPSST